MKKCCFIVALLMILALPMQAMAAAIPADGEYTVEAALSGGSGKASVESPARLSVTGGKMTAAIVWNSPNYTYMEIDGERYDRLNADGNSTFEIPIEDLDAEIAFSAQTVAMSEPHVIEYTLRFDPATLKAGSAGEQAATTASADAPETQTDWRRNKAGLGNGLKPQRSMELRYAQNFSVDYYEGGYALVSISDGSRFLTIPEGMPVPEGIDGGITVLEQPMDDIYLVATSAMCLFDALEALGSISLSGTKAGDWYIENARAAMEAGDILYAGKYGKPDYELILASGCRLAIESTMINHAPEVKEKLQDLGIPVLVEQSSFEPHPLGRMEWIKLYAALTGKEEVAQRVFDEQAAYLDEVAGRENTGKTVAFFYVASNGSVIARKSGDYITKMIELAGGNYVFQNLGDPQSATSTVALEMEQFYAAAKEADCIIYNNTIDGTVTSLGGLLEKNELFRDFKAVQNGNVWCTGKNLFQETTQTGLMISDIREMLTADGGLEELNYMYVLR